MNQSMRIALSLICGFLLLSLPACTKSPAGFQNVVDEQVGAFERHVATPDKILGLATQWAVDPATSLAFFDSKLASSDTQEVKAALLSIWALTKVVEDPDSKVGTEARSRFKSAFPTEKIRTVLKAHPECAQFASGLKHTSHGPDLPEIK